MADVDEFLASVLPPLTAADTAMHNGDAAPRIALWSHDEPVTLFGALQIKAGWREIAPVFDSVASRFSNCESFGYEVLAAGVGGDLAYIAGIDHTTAAVGDGPGPGVRAARDDHLPARRRRVESGPSARRSSPGQ